MGDVEQAGRGSRMEVLLQHARGVLHGHVIARERHHLAAKGHMQGVERGMSERFLVVGY